MRFVLDSSAALPWVLPEWDSAKAIQLRDDARNAVHELLAADKFPAEVFNALLKAERIKRISVGESKTLYASIGAHIPAQHRYLPLMPRAGEIASRCRVALYD
jgi:predicted nucleic acid-binding protein